LASDEISTVESLLVEVLREGKQVSPRPTIDEMRATREMDVERLDPGVRRIMFPHIYHVSLTQKLWDLKQDLIRSARRVYKFSHFAATFGSSASDPVRVCILAENQ